MNTKTALSGAAVKNIYNTARTSGAFSPDRLSAFRQNMAKWMQYRTTGVRNPRVLNTGAANTGLTTPNSTALSVLGNKLPPSNTTANNGWFKIPSWAGGVAGMGGILAASNYLAGNNTNQPSVTQQDPYLAGWENASYGKAVNPSRPIIPGAIHSMFPSDPTYDIPLQNNPLYQGNYGRWKDLLSKASSDSLVSPNLQLNQPVSTSNIPYVESKPNSLNNYAVSISKSNMPRWKRLHDIFLHPPTLSDISTGLKTVVRNKLKPLATLTSLFTGVKTSAIRQSPREHGEQVNLVDVMKKRNVDSKLAPKSTSKFLFTQDSIGDGGDKSVKSSFSKISANLGPIWEAPEVQVGRGPGSDIISTRVGPLAGRTKTSDLLSDIQDLLDQGNTLQPYIPPDFSLSQPASQSSKPVLSIPDILRAAGVGSATSGAAQPAPAQTDNGQPSLGDLFIRQVSPSQANKTLRLPEPRDVVKYLAPARGAPVAPPPARPGLSELLSQKPQSSSNSVIDALDKGQFTPPSISSSLTRQVSPSQAIKTLQPTPTAPEGVVSNSPKQTSQAPAGTGGGLDLASANPAIAALYGDSGSAIDRSREENAQKALRQRAKAQGRATPAMGQGSATTPEEAVKSDSAYFPQAAPQAAPSTAPEQAGQVGRFYGAIQRAKALTGNRLAYLQRSLAKPNLSSYDRRRLEGELERINSTGETDEVRRLTAMQNNTAEDYLRQGFSPQAVAGWQGNNTTKNNLNVSTRGYWEQDAANTLAAEKGLPTVANKNIAYTGPNTKGVSGVPNSQPTLGQGASGASLANNAVKPVNPAVGSMQQKPVGQISAAPKLPTQKPGLGSPLGVPGQKKASSDVGPVVDADTARYQKALELWNARNTQQQTAHSMHEQAAQSAGGLVGMAAGMYAFPEAVRAGLINSDKSVGTRAAKAILPFLGKYTGLNRRVLGFANSLRNAISASRPFRTSWEKSGPRSTSQANQMWEAVQKAVASPSKTISTNVLPGPAPYSGNPFIDAAKRFAGANRDRQKGFGNIRSAINDTSDTVASTIDALFAGSMVGVPGVLGVQAGSRLLGPGEFKPTQPPPPPTVKTAGGAFNIGQKLFSGISGAATKYLGPSAAKTMYNYAGRPVVRGLTGAAIGGAADNVAELAGYDTGNSLAMAGGLGGIGLGFRQSRHLLNNAGRALGAKKPVGSLAEKFLTYGRDTNTSLIPGLFGWSGNNGTRMSKTRALLGNAGVVAGLVTPMAMARGRESAMDTANALAQRAGFQNLDHAISSPAGQALLHYNNGGILGALKGGWNALSPSAKLALGAGAAGLVGGATMATSPSTALGLGALGLGGLGLGTLTNADYGTLFSGLGPAVSSVASAAAPVMDGAGDAMARATQANSVNQLQAAQG